MTFGSLYLREIGNPELRRFLEPFAKLKPASRLRYLRELSACLAVAVGDRYLEVNPVPAFTKATKLKPPKRGKAPFEDGELERLWTELGKVEDDEERVYLYACRFSAETGLRLGELIALDWTNVDLLNGRVRVEHQWDDGTGSLIEPEDREPRVVYLTPHARAVLDEWTAIVGVQTEGPVFPAPGGSRLGRRVLQRRFAEAMASAGIPKEHPDLRPASHIPLAPLFDQRAHAAAGVPPTADRGDARARLAGIDVRRLRRLDTRDAPGGGGARASGVTWLRSPGRAGYVLPCGLEARGAVCPARRYRFSHVGLLPQAPLSSGPYAMLAAEVLRRTHRPSSTSS